MKKITKKVLYEFIKEKLRTNNVWALKALRRIYQDQTFEERNKRATISHNGIGFTGFDAEFLTSLVKSDRSFTVKQWSFLRKTISKYWKQIYEACDKDKLNRRYLEENVQLSLFDKGESMSFKEADKKTIATINADHRDTEGLIKSFKKAIGALGGKVLSDPRFAGTDQYGFVVVKKGTKRKK